MARTCWKGVALSAAVVFSSLCVQSSSFVLMPSCSRARQELFGLAASALPQANSAAAVLAGRRPPTMAATAMRDSSLAMDLRVRLSSRRRRTGPALQVSPMDSGCASEDECEITYDDDEEDAVVEPAAAVGVIVAETTGPETTQDIGEQREGLDNMQKVLDDGYEKQDMVKWREAEVMENGPASADERCRLLTLRLVGGEGLEWEFSRATWLDTYKVPGQFVGIRLDNGGAGGVAGSLVAVSTEPTLVRQNNGEVQLLVTDDASFRLKGHVGGAPEELKDRSLAALERGDRVKLSDFVGRGFSSLFVGWIGLLSALQEQRDIVIIASGARGLGSVKAVLDWPPVQAHAGIKRVSVYMEDESPASAPFLNDILGWRSAGIRVVQSFTHGTPGVCSSAEETIFGQADGLRGAVGGDPAAATFLMAGLPGQRAMELTDRLTDDGVDPGRLLFNEFF